MARKLSGLLTMPSGNIWETDNRKRTLGIRDKKILYRNAKGRCQNPACKKKIDFDEMQVGHKNKAFSKGGSTNLRNSVCLCYRCNNQQGTDSWATFLRKQNIAVPKKRSTTKMTRKIKRKKSGTGYSVIDPWTGKRQRIKPLFKF